MSTTDLEKAMAGNANPVPRGNHVRYAGAHWLELCDSDGHRHGLEVFQWQPQAQRWCRPNQYATIHGDVDLSRYVYVGPVSLPLEGERHAQAVELLAALRQAHQRNQLSEQVSAKAKSSTLRIPAKHFELLQELLYHMV